MSLTPKKALQALILVALPALPALIHGQGATRSPAPAAIPTPPATAATPTPPAAPPADIAAKTPPAFPRGRVVEKVACTAHPEQSYQLYLPSGYDPARRWPLLIAMDARGVAEVPMVRFSAAGERHGWIVVSSYNSASDGSMQVNVDAVRALWQDTHTRFSIDDRRIYMAGFSGTVRASCALAFVSPGTIAGVIGAGAGFPFKRPPDAKTDFGFFGTVGDKDFNFYEMLDLEAKLTDLGLPHRIERFDGIHQWMPEELAAQGVEWMELRAMKEGRRAKDPALVEAIWSREMAAARAEEAKAGGATEDGQRSTFRAWHRYAALADDLTGLRDVAEATAKAAALAAGEPYRIYVKQRSAAAARDRQYLREAPRLLGNRIGANPGASVETIASGTDAAALKSTLAALDVAGLKEKAARLGESDEGQSAQRLLSTISAQTAFYLPREAEERKDFARAAFLLRIALEIHPDAAGTHFNLARALAQGGERRPALDELQRAADLGLADPDRLQSTAAFASLREDPAYQKVLAKMKQDAAAPQPSEPSSEQP